MQQVEMFSHIKIWPEGLSGNDGYTTSDLQRTHAPSVLPFLW